MVLHRGTDIGIKYTKKQNMATNKKEERIVILVVEGE
jgi:hypothetical protein